ncbi:PIG-L family deacetylase [Candidatus Pelagibacter sp.]|nr:PIG-L family deacetylase [Candidatus Pelagibacter sp.]|tara:strand:- start:744 stop:1400 length:657 start_codon:yes stop_codon:yes gene_type:complete
MIKNNILIISPHADDAEIAMGGTISKLAKEGHKITILTAIFPKENLKGDVNKYMSNNRKKEQEKSIRILGAKLIALNIDPYKFTFNREFVKLFDKKVKELKPNIIFSCWEHDTHQDHKTISNVIYSVTRKNNISLFQYEPMMPGGINTNSFNGQLYVDISSHIKNKMKAIKSYKSVFGKKQNTESYYFDAIKGRAAYRGQIIGVRFAECFLVVKKLEI